jgi:hypothetical protein
MEQHSDASVVRLAAFWILPWMKMRKTFARERTVAKRCGVKLHVELWMLTQFCCQWFEPAKSEQRTSLPVQFFEHLSSRFCCRLSTAAVRSSLLGVCCWLNIQKSIRLELIRTEPRHKYKQSCIRWHQCPSDFPSLLLCRRFLMDWSKLYEVCSVMDLRRIVLSRGFDGVTLHWSDLVLWESIIWRETLSKSFSARYNGQDVDAPYGLYIAPRKCLGAHSKGQKFGNHLRYVLRS